MNRADPFSNFDGCGDGRFDLLNQGAVDKLYNLWDRNPVTVSASYLKSGGKRARDLVIRCAYLGLLVVFVIVAPKGIVGLVQDWHVSEAAYAEAQGN